MTDGAKQWRKRIAALGKMHGSDCDCLQCKSARIALAVEAHLKYWRGRPGYCGQKDAIRLLEAIKAGEDPDNDRG